MNEALVRVLERQGQIFRCPNNGRILVSVSEHDDKVLCGCGKTVIGNPQGMPFTDAPGTHFKRFLPKATAAEYIQQGKPTQS